MKRHHWLLVMAVVSIGVGAWLMKGTNANPTTPTVTQTGQFAVDRGNTTSTSPAILEGSDQTKPVDFQGERAMKYLKQVCDLGPRISSTKQHTLMVNMLDKHFSLFGAKVTKQRFDYKQRSQKEKTPMVNLMASWNPEKRARLLICTHYDTRPAAHEEQNRRDWGKPFIGANDGGSGVAWMMEMAHHMRDLKTSFGIDFVCFDGEEYIFDNRQSDMGGDLYFAGSEHFAREYVASARRSNAEPYYEAAVLLDMIAGRNPRFLYEGYSWANSSPVLKEVWGIANQQKCSTFVNELGHQVLDDHLALIRVAGIQAIDIVPCGNQNDDRFLTYPFWHKLDDTPSNCDPEGMIQVSKVLSIWMQTKKPK